MLRPTMLLLLLAAPLAAQQPPAPPPPPACQDDPRYRTLDFWLGEWEVRSPDGALQGTNRIETVLDGCAVMEHWTSASGGEGKSWFYYDWQTDGWTQIWMTTRAGVPGGTKVKHLVARLPDGGVRFQGELRTPPGATYLDRTTLTPMADGRVRQVIEISTDEGASWRRTFEGIYVRSGRSGPGER